MVDSPMAAALESTVLRVSDVVDLLPWFKCWPISSLISLISNSACWFALHSEIGPAHAIVRAQGLIVAFQYDAARFQNVAMVG